ncbi:MAG: capsular polysaccharide biosynthesis protein, partial [Clostridia bacterium]|nr:capsular polysaccharide biosynthesis protein [Clostridia bacterium]
MIDVHSHILPEFDDGAKSVDESINMLKILKDQGITHVIATPHFKMTDDKKSIDDFLIKREESYQKLISEI